MSIQEKNTNTNSGKFRIRIPGLSTYVQARYCLIWVVGDEKTRRKEIASLER